MITVSDIRGYFRDLFYLQEKFLVDLERADLPDDVKMRLRDQIIRKQVMISSVMRLLVLHASKKRRKLSDLF